MNVSSRNVAGVPNQQERCTEFQLHMGRIKNIIDFTEQRLLWYAERASDPQQKVTLAALVRDYRGGLVAVAWKRGEPSWIKVTRGA